jgi:predicted  nucleic acid-binding Zn-ribbon protein
MDHSKTNQCDKNNCSLSKLNSFFFSFQTNFYVDDGDDPPAPRPLLCDLCEEGHDASFTCATCQAYFCTRCRRMHDKLCKSGHVTPVTPRSTFPAKEEQEEENEDEGKVPRSSSELDIIESLLKKLKEKEKKEEAEKKKTKESLSMSGVSGTREVSAYSRGGAESGEGVASLAATVSQLLKQVSGLERHITGLQTQNTLMTSLIDKQEKVMTSLHDKHDKEMTSIKAACKKDRDAVTSLEREVAGLRDKNAILCQDKEQLRTQLDKMHDDVTKSHNDVTKLQAENDKLKTDHAHLQTKHAQLHKEVNAVKCELSHVKTEQDKLQADVNKQGTDADVYNCHANKKFRFKQICFFFL